MFSRPGEASLSVKGTASVSPKGPGTPRFYILSLTHTFTPIPGFQVLGNGKSLTFLIFEAFKMQLTKSIMLHNHRGFPDGSAVKNLPANSGDTGDVGSAPELGRCPGEGNGTPLQYFCLRNPIDSGAWQAIVHRVAKS